MLATIYKSTGSWYIAKAENGGIYNARMKGVFKIDDITSTNPVAVGDIVDIEPEDSSGNNAVINDIYERSNYIARSSPRRNKQHHIIASNLDQALLIATLKEPKTSQGFIDRCLVGAEAYHVPSIIVFNKTDVYRTKEWDAYKKFEEMYEKIGYAIYKISMKTYEGLDEVKQLLQHKISHIGP